MWLRDDKFVMKINHLLKWIKKNDSNNISILLRHAPREDIPKNLFDQHKISLTDEGKKLAIEFGRDLPKSIYVKLFYSPISRCKETAECILRGVRSNQGNAVLMGEKDFLGIQFIIDIEEWGNMVRKTNRNDLARKWLNSELDGSIISDPHKVVKEIMTGLVATMKENTNRHSIDLHITHDLNVLSVRDILLKTRHEEVGWPENLDGIILTNNNDKLILRWRYIVKTTNLKDLNIGNTTL